MRVTRASRPLRERNVNENVYVRYVNVTKTKTKKEKKRSRDPGLVGRKTFGVVLLLAHLDQSGTIRVFFRKSPVPVQGPPGE